MHSFTDNSPEKIHALEKKHYKLSFQVNLMLLIAHICLLSLFAYLQVTLMVYVNIISIAIYIGLFFYYKKNLIHYVFIVFIEVMIHMALATVSVGMSGGFQFYSFCLVPCIFLCDYLSRSDGRKGMHPFLISAILIVIFLLTRIYCYQYGSIYQPTHRQVFLFLYVYNAIITFVFLIVYMHTFENSILHNEKRLEEMAVIDQLTQLPNRYLMKDWLADAFRLHTKSSQLAIAILDIDDFKHLNDTYGHAAGDQALRRLAECIQLSTGNPIKVARWGGEEFVFLSLGEDAYMRLYAALEKLRADVASQIIDHGDMKIHMTVTIGLSQYTDGDTSFEDILKRADQYLYIGKNRGKNRIEPKG